MRSPAYVHRKHSRPDRPQSSTLSSISSYDLRWQGGVFTEVFQPFYSLVTIGIDCAYSAVPVIFLLTLQTPTPIRRSAKLERLSRLIKASVDYNSIVKRCSRWCCRYVILSTS